MIEERDQRRSEWPQDHHGKELLLISQRYSYMYWYIIEFVTSVALSDILNFGHMYTNRYSGCIHITSACAYSCMDHHNNYNHKIVTRMRILKRDSRII